MLVGGLIVLGLLVGSHMGVVADRVPAGRSPLGGRSACSSCGRVLGFVDLVPLISWLGLRGRCRGCGAAIGWEAPAAELATAAGFGAVGARLGWTAVLPAFLVLVAGLVALSLIDLRTQQLPRRIIWVTGGLGLLAMVVAAIVDQNLVPLAWAAFGAATAFAAFAVIHFVRPDAMGFGDVRLAALLGLHLGWIGPAHVPVGLFLGFLLGAVVGVAMMVGGRAGRRTALPFGPFMALGAMVAIVAGRPIIDAWLHR